ncbi:hypothetical protein C8R48DRAFT_777773 [Suillus tomentosus]|nr:hypothetical protein C8R48DRAFT_777773 [Suillus tomentosus]
MYYADLQIESRDGSVDHDERSFAHTNLLPETRKWTKGQPETETSSSTHLDVDVGDNGSLVDLTVKVVKESTHAIAQGSFGDVWKCILSEKDIRVEVAVKCIRIKILDGRFKDIVRKWKPLRYDHILPLCGITYVFGPVPAIVSPSMPSGSLSTYLDEYYDGLSGAHKFGFVSLSQRYSYTTTHGGRNNLLK